MTDDSTEQVTPALAALASALGVSVSYNGWNGEERPCSAGAIRAALAAMGVDADDDEACEASLATFEAAEWRRAVPPVTMVRQGATAELAVHVRDGDPVSVTLTLEDGGVKSLAQIDKWVEPREIDGRIIGVATFALPSNLPLGWHIVEANAPGRRVRGFVVVSPPALRLPAAVASKRAWGFMTQLYSLRSERSWGMGDLGDLGDLCALAARKAGADFVLVNPLHACEPIAPISPSPYLPVSRRYLSPLYIRVEDIPEVAYFPSTQRAVLEWESERPRRVNGTDALIDRDGVWRAKSAALTKVFEAGRSGARQAQFEAFKAAEGGSLANFATWCAIGEEQRGLTWPEGLSTPTSADVPQFIEEHQTRIEYFEWLQWIADEQLAAAQRIAKSSGMSIGVMGDLAVGVHPSGADAWSLGRVLATGIGVGAPPDMYNQQGQDWSQPPWQPRALEAYAYLPYRDVVRTALRNVGALRIDHILGLFRLWWVPKGRPASDGVYVTYDHEILVGILCLEAERAGAVVIGEDLGTVEPWVRDYLVSRGILGTSVVWFEKDAEGKALAPERYRRSVLASVTTHDLPPTAAYLAGEHVTLREELGLLEENVEDVRNEAVTERADMVHMLRRRGLLGEDDAEEEVIVALHRLLMNTPASLVGVALTDAVGERKTQNLPGTFNEHPNWKFPLTDADGKAVVLDELFDHPRMVRLVEAIRANRV